MNEQFQMFNDSFERCITNPQFLSTFYEIFIASSPEVKEKFKNTDMEKQKDVLLASLAFIMYADKNPDPLHEIAQSHDKNHLDIRPELYTNWTESMIKALEIIDPLFSKEIETAWRETLKPGIDYMIKNY